MVSGGGGPQVVGLTHQLLNSRPWSGRGSGNREGVDCFKGKFAYGQIRKSRASEAPLCQPFSPTRGWSAGSCWHRCHQETEKAAGSPSVPPWDDAGLSFHEWIEKPSFIDKKEHLPGISFLPKVSASKG